MDDAHQADDQMVTFNSLQIKTTQTDGGRWHGGVQLKATNVATPYATCPPIMTEINIEDVGIAKFECDTAASHNIMSEGLYKNLRN